MTGEKKRYRKVVLFVIIKMTCFEPCARLLFSNLTALKLYEFYAPVPVPVISHHLERSPFPISEFAEPGNEYTEVTSMINVSPHLAILVKMFDVTFLMFLL